jgi:hypothetical protein
MNDFNFYAVLPFVIVLAIFGVLPATRLVGEVLITVIRFAKREIAPRVPRRSEAFMRWQEGGPAPADSDIAKVRGANGQTYEYEDTSRPPTGSA